MGKRFIAVAMALPLAACGSMAPQYQRPAAPIPAEWPSGAAYAPSSESGAAAPAVAWREFVKNEQLRAVIELALANSRDLRTAIANVAAARAQYRIERAELLPPIDAEISSSRTRGLSTFGGTAGSVATTETQSAGASLSAFEIDLFGRQRSLSTAAFEAYLATEEAARATRIALIAEVASAYLRLATDRSLLALAQRTLESAQRSMELTTRRLEAGVASRVDVKQAETVYQQARTDLASLTIAIAQDRNALELLAGARVDDALLPDELRAEAEWFADVPAGVSSEVLLERPDVLAAEHNLVSANADIGAARAAFFPTLALTASRGVASTALSSLLDNGANVWSVASTLTAPIFRGGANRANLAYSEAQRDRYLSDYELAIQTAFKEVADALAVHGTIQRQRDAQVALVAAAAESYRLAEARYSEGTDTFLNALDAQRTLYAAEQSLTSTRSSALDNLVTLYRVLGGGLTDGTEEIE